MARLGSESASDVNGRCQNNSTCQLCHAILRWFIDELTTSKPRVVAGVVLLFSYLQGNLNKDNSKR